MKLKRLIKVADKWSKKIDKPVTIYLPPGKYTDSITLSNGISLSGISEEIAKTNDGFEQRTL